MESILIPSLHVLQCAAALRAFEKRGQVPLCEAPFGPSRQRYLTPFFSNALTTMPMLPQYLNRQTFATAFNIYQLCRIGPGCHKNGNDRPMHRY